METIVGISGKDFVVLAGTTAISRSIVMMKNDFDRIFQLDDHKLLAFTGEPGDTVQFCEFIHKNMQLYYYQNGIRLGPEGAANYTRNTLAEGLRSSPYQANLLLAAFDEHEGSSLYFIDYLASKHKVKHASHGYGSFFLSGIIDRHYTENITLDDAIDLVRLGLEELKTRFFVSTPNFTVKAITKDGVQVIKL